MAIIVEIVDTKQIVRDESGTDVWVSAIAYDEADPRKTVIDRIDVTFDLDGFLNQYKSNAARLAAIQARMTEWGQGIKARAEKTGTLARALVGQTVRIE